MRLRGLLPKRDTFLNSVSMELKSVGVGHRDAYATAHPMPTSLWLRGNTSAL